jgi:CubicO group peptidase (beta-lactamase class C family)
MKLAMKCSFILALLAVQVAAEPLPKTKPEEVGMSSERLQRISQMLQRRIDAKEMAGAVAIVARKGKVVHLSAQGVMDLESKQPMTPATMFRIASMTKPVTSLAIMMMIEEGKVRLNDPVSRYIPEFKGLKVAVALPGGRGGGGGAPPAQAGGRGGAPTPEFYTVPPQREVTVKDLLTHVSGLGSGAMGNSEIRKQR